MKLQGSQKHYYDTLANKHSIHMRDQVYVYTSAKKVGTAYKFVCPFVGPYMVFKPPYKVR